MYGPSFNVVTVLLIVLQSFQQVHVKSESLAIKISQEINYAKSLYYEQQLMLPASANEDCLLLESWSHDFSEEVIDCCRS